MLNRPVSPCDCALALAIPLSQAEFLRDLEDEAPKDLAKSILREWPLRGEIVYAEKYTPLVSLARDVAEEARSHGVTVCRPTRLDDLPELFEQHKVVTLVAHWCFIDLQAGDISDVDSFRTLLTASAAVENGNDDLPNRPTDALLRDDPLVQAAVTAADLAAALNRLLLPSQRYYEWVPSAGEEVPSGTDAIAGITRVLLEEMYPGFIAQGLCLELADRLCSVWEFIQSVPRDFDGIVDMTVCNSIIPAEALRRHRSDCNVVCNTYRARAEVRLEIYRHVIRSLAAKSEPFEEVSARAHRLLRAAMRTPQAADVEAVAQDRPAARVWTRFGRLIRNWMM